MIPSKRGEGLNDLMSAARAQLHAAIYAAWAQEDGDRVSTLYNQERSAFWSKRARQLMGVEPWIGSFGGAAAFD